MISSQILLFFMPLKADPFYILPGHDLRVSQNYAVKMVVDTEAVAPAGVLLVAKHREAATALHMQFQNRSVRKTYLAIACGVPPEASFGVDAPVDRHDTIKCALA